MVKSVVDMREVLVEVLRPSSVGIARFSEFLVL
mgnify:CR=1 FL=1